MLTMNRATLVGHAGRNPEMRTLPSGDEVASFSLATTERFKRRDGTEGEATEWHAIVAFGAAAEAVRTLVRRGDPVLVEGRVATRSWTDRKGTEHRTTEIVVAGPRSQVNVLAKRRREPDGGDEPPGGARQRQEWPRPRNADRDEGVGRRGCGRRFCPENRCPARRAPRRMPPLPRRPPPARKAIRRLRRRHDRQARAFRSGRCAAGATPDGDSTKGQRRRCGKSGRRGMRQRPASTAGQGDAGHD